MIPLLRRIFAATVCACIPSTTWADSAFTVLRFEHFFGGPADQFSLRVGYTHDRAEYSAPGLEIPLYNGRGYATALKDKPRDIAFGFILGAGVLAIAYAVIKENEKSSRVEVRGGFPAVDTTAQHRRND